MGELIKSIITNLIKRDIARIRKSHHTAASIKLHVLTYLL